MNFSTDYIARRGREIYEARLRSVLEPESTGKYIVIDIETGDYEVDCDGDAASRRVYSKKPNGIRYGMRIGYSAWGHIGLGSDGGKVSIELL